MRSGITRRTAPPLALAVASLALPACAARHVATIDALQAQPPREYRGHHDVARGSWFTPCGADAADAWWVTATGRAAAQVDSARRDGRLTPSAPVFARWLGVETTGGEVGPRGPGKPALLARELLALRERRPDDCRQRITRITGSESWIGRPTDPRLRPRDPPAPT